MAILDLEPTFDEIADRAEKMFGDRYLELAWRRMLTDFRNPVTCDMEHAAEQELIREKRLQAESKDAIVIV